jgi:cyclophilin family peptidyl-prolyl cis-trans isomerase
MLQGGDPDGTGRGGESFFGGKIRDEFDERLVRSLTVASQSQHCNVYISAVCGCEHIIRISLTWSSASAMSNGEVVTAGRLASLLLA